MAVSGFVTASVVFLSRYRATATLPMFDPRLNAIKLYAKSPPAPARTVGSAAALRPYTGELLPVRLVSCGYPGTSVLYQVSPQLIDVYQPTQASPVSLSPGSPRTFTA